MIADATTVASAEGGWAATPLLVIFDCDGVLIDSEPASRGLLAEEATRHGATLSPADARRFTGLRWSDLQTPFEQLVGRSLGPGWPSFMQAELITRLEEQVRAMPGAAASLRGLAALGIAIRVASNSSHAEMEAKFAATGLAPLVQGRLHSAQDVGRGKPAPDLFLAAAAAQGVQPGQCLVIEDSRPGVTAALAAGMRCLAYVPEGDDNGLLALGALPLLTLAALPCLLRPGSAGAADGRAA